MGRRTRSVVIASLTVWLLAVIAWLILLRVEDEFGCPGLIDPSGSADSQTWRWVPPGVECRYHVTESTSAYSSGEHVDQPPTSRLAVVALLIVWPTLTVAFARAAAFDRREPHLNEPMRRN